MAFCKDVAFKDESLECKISILPPNLFLLTPLAHWLICDIPPDPETIYANYVFQLTSNFHVKQVILSDEHE